LIEDQSTVLIAGQLDSKPVYALLATYYATSMQEI